MCQNRAVLVQWYQWGAPQREGAPKLGEFRPWGLSIHVLPVLHVPAGSKGLDKEPLGCAAPTSLLFHIGESIQEFVPACSGCWGCGGDPSGLEVGFGAHSIAAYVEATGVPNLLPPILLDVSQGWETWGGTQPATLDLVVSINMMHIAELRCTEVSGPRQPLSPARAEEGPPGRCPQSPDLVPTSLVPQGLFKGAGVLLKPGGVLFTYGVGPVLVREHPGGCRVSGRMLGEAGGRAAPGVA